MADSDYEYDYSDDEGYPVNSDDGEDEAMEWHPSQDAENPNAAPMMAVKCKFDTQGWLRRFLRQIVPEIQSFLGSL
jgi:hypothetical protein